MMKQYDLVIVGAGIFGLSLAAKAVLGGRSVLLVDEGELGAGASGGVLGSVMPHIPKPWNAKKAYQFLAHLDLADWAGFIEGETGLSTGYGRVGRVIPVATEGMRRHAVVRAEASLPQWRTAETGFELTYDPDARMPELVSDERARFGLLRDNFSARVHPRRYCAALLAFCRARGAAFLPHHAYRGFDDVAHVLSLHNGSADACVQVRAGQVVLAAGYQTFALLAPMLGRSLGGGVKGQALRYRVKEGVTSPLSAILYDDGIYIVPHADGTIAVGSSSEKVWDFPHTTDHIADDLADRVQVLCPWLSDVADEVDRWAGVRPHCLLREPMLGRLPDTSSLYVATGGFKISFGIAHRIAADMLAHLDGAGLEATDLPETFHLAHHLRGEG